MLAARLHSRWSRVATALLHALAEAHLGSVEIETLDIIREDEIEALHKRMSGRRFEIVFANAGATNWDPSQIIGEATTKDFVSLTVTNALSPMR